MSWDWWIGFVLLGVAARCVWGVYREMKPRIEVKRFTRIARAMSYDPTMWRAEVTINDRETTLFGSHDSWRYESNAVDPGPTISLKIGDAFALMQHRKQMKADTGP